MSYTEYGFYRRNETEERYSEYGCIRRDGRGEIPGSDDSDFDEQYKNFVSFMKSIIELKNAGYEITDDDRKALIDGKITIEELKARAASSSDTDGHAVDDLEKAVQEHKDEPSVDAKPVAETKQRKRSKKKKAEIPAVEAAQEN